MTESGARHRRTSTVCARRCASSPKGCTRRTRRARSTATSSLRTSSWRDDGRVVLLDFGVAAELSRAVDRRHARVERRRDARVHGARAGPRRDADARERLVQRRRPPLRGARRQAALRRRLGETSSIERPSSTRPRRASWSTESRPTSTRSAASCCGASQESDPTGAGCCARLGVETRPLSPTPIAGQHPRDHPRRAEHGAARAAPRVREGAHRRRGDRARARARRAWASPRWCSNFLDGLVTRTDAVVLRGCAYERESIAYKAVDGVVDALSRYLVAFESARARHRAPRGRLGARVPLPRPSPGPGIVAEPAGATSTIRSPAAAGVRRAARDPVAARAASVRRSCTSTTCSGATSTARRCSSR